MKLRGLYVITDTALCAPRGIAADVRAALEGGARVVQYRDKTHDAERRLQEACALRALCEEHDALFLVNDDIELAKACDAHGVHVGREDVALRDARRTLGEHAVIGVSCYDDVDLAREAQAAGADYVAFGSVFTSAIKPGAVRAPLSLFARARNELNCPTCAIGGISVENIEQVIEAGASMTAVISAVFAASDVRSAAAELSRHFR